jgi:predicted nucleic acid-binding Zn ribbon protein
MTLSDAPPAESASQTEHTVSSDRLCEGCGIPLVGRRPQARFCSDSCRTAVGRHRHTTRLLALLTAIERAVAALRLELEGGHDAP